MSKKREADHPDFAAAYKALSDEREGVSHLPRQPRGEEVEVLERTPPSEELVLALQEAQETIAILNQKLDSLLAAPKIFGRVIRYNNVPNPDAFKKGDFMYILDEEHPKYLKVCKIAEDINMEDGSAVIEFKDGERDCLLLGLEGKGKAQLKILDKDDGTYAVVVVGDTPYEVGSLPGWEFELGCQVKVNIQSKQIYGLADMEEAGIIAYVVNATDGEAFVEIEIDGEKKQVYSGPKPEEALEEGDRVVVDNAKQVIIRHIPRDKDKRYTIDCECQVTWDDVGGLEEAKEAIKEAVELPFQFPEIFAHYQKSPPKGVLLYGPPGCGKTLIGKATTNSLATIYGAKAISSGFIYVKGPEILNMYVGNTERNIREMFAKGRKHYEKHGFPAVLFIDESEAVLSERGTSRSSDVDKTIVPMFLSEMDGLVENRVLVMLATNRPKMLDPAVVREGRVDRHIKIARPTRETAPAIFEIHLRNIPTVGIAAKEIAARATADIFHERRKMYQIKNGDFTGFFTMGDCVSGAMIAGIVQQATSAALKRDITDKTRTGITANDIKGAVETIFTHHHGLNHKFDLEDYFERHGLNEDACEVARVRVKAA